MGKVWAVDTIALNFLMKLVPQTVPCVLDGEITLLK